MPAGAYFPANRYSDTVDNRSVHRNAHTYPWLLLLWKMMTIGCNCIARFPASHTVALGSLAKSISPAEMLPTSMQESDGLVGVAHLLSGPHRLAQRHPKKQRGRTARFVEDWLIRSVCRTTTNARRGDWMDQVALACCFCIRRKEERSRL